MTKEVLFREATQQDQAELYHLMVEYIVDFYKQPTPNEGELRKLIANLLDDHLFGKQFVAEINGKLAGFATLYYTFSTLSVKRAAVLNDLYVKPESRGLKIGEGLFQTCLTYIRENNFSSMVWETAKDNEIAQALYNKMGGKQSEWMHYEIT